VLEFLCSFVSHTLSEFSPYLRLQEAGAAEADQSGGLKDMSKVPPPTPSYELAPQFPDIFIIVFDI
jgi:hypothetical protein